MSAGAQMVTLVESSSMFLKMGLDGKRHSSLTPTRLCVATEHTKICCSCCSGSASELKQPVWGAVLHGPPYMSLWAGEKHRKELQQKQGRGLKLRRFPSKGVRTSVLDLNCLRTERKFLIFASSVDDKGSYLNRNEVVELLSDAVETLLKPENQKRLRERLEKSKQRIGLQQSKLFVQPSNVDQWNSLAPTNCLQDLGVIHPEMEGDTIESGRCPSDQVSGMTTSVTVPLTSQMTELVESEEQPRSIENLESPTESVEGKVGSSLTSIRRLKVLDVHSYVHKALRESALRSWLNSRTIEE